MGRIRTVKPEFWLDEDLSGVNPESALLAIGLLNYSDDYGYFKAHPGLIQAAIFPLRELSYTVPRMIDELSRIGYIELWSGVDGKKYGRVLTFSTHQRVDRKKPSVISEIERIDDTSSNAQRSNKDESTQEGKGTGKGREGKGREYTSSGDDGVTEKPRFEEFWKAYPQKADKKKAQAIWKRRKLDQKAETIITDVLNRIANDKKWADGYIPNPTTYLNGDRWEDEMNGGGIQKLSLADRMIGQDGEVISEQ